jgi:hypothetical protein
VIPWYRICSASGLVSFQSSGVPSASRPMARGRLEDHTGGREE